jgi:threonine/homoserine/homoserine lactone efflux protein
LNIALLTVFVPTFFFVSITPGLCMTLAMTMGMTIGVRRALWMMAGELVGVALVAVLAAVGVAALLLNYPTAFNAFKIMGGLYLGFIGVQMWLSRGKMAIKTDVSNDTPASRTELAFQGFMTAVSNPKGWAFFVALLPPFLSPDSSLFSQLLILVSIILVLEFMCLLIYASGGVTLRSILMKNSNVRVMNRIAGSLMIGVGLWLAVG